MVTKFGLIRIGRLSGYTINDVIDVCRRGHVSIFDIYKYKSGLLSVTYGVTVRGEEEDIHKVVDIINKL